MTIDIRQKQRDFWGMSRHDQMLKQFLEFHKAHPEVWSVFCGHVDRLIQRGFDYYSARSLIGVMRFQQDVGDTKGTLKINDHYSAFYGRAYCAKYPDRSDFFKMRVQRSKNTGERNNVDSIDDPDFERADWATDETMKLFE